MRTRNSKDGGSAFPFHHKYSDGGVEMSDGMTLRDYFAGKAMNSIMSNPKCQGYDHAATEAYRMADAMLHARGAQ
ncbi:hypothetical protein [Burkholderia anthina]|uniref:hypothetical protein n=1 Tax=Burkholderia anthina TaxID=179879 RepID=UPI00158B0B2E|nr:hypothetical protein [Burkholderia anthina]